MPFFMMAIEHNGEPFWTEVFWDSTDGYGISGLGFTVRLAASEERDPTPDEVKRYGQELLKRYEQDSDFMQRVSEAIYEYTWGE